MISFLLTFGKFFATVWRAMRDDRFRALFASASAIVLAGTLFYRAAEGWSWLDSLYFSVITLTTVGYGDLAPETAAGKIFTIVYILLGVGILATFVATMAQYATAGPGRGMSMRGGVNAPPDESADDASGD